MAGYVALAVLVALAGFAAYVRFAPSDPARWHVDPLAGLATGGALPALSQPGAPPVIVTTLNSAAARLPAPDSDRPALARLDAIALATPRTTRLAGSAEAGRITWVTRSALWGFPDYTTAEVAVGEGGTPVLTILGRARFGQSDLGVNAARLRDWLSRL